MAQHKWHIGDNRIDVPRHPKEWQGLTDEEVDDACKNSDERFNLSAFRQGVNWAEQKLKEKNHDTT